MARIIMDIDGSMVVKIKNSFIEIIKYLIQCKSRFTVSCGHTITIFDGHGSIIRSIFTNYMHKFFGRTIEIGANGESSVGWHFPEFSYDIIKYQYVVTAYLTNHLRNGKRCANHWIIENFSETTGEGRMYEEWRSSTIPKRILNILNHASDCTDQSVIKKGSFIIGLKKKVNHRNGCYDEDLGFSNIVSLEYLKEQ